MSLPITYPIEYIAQRAHIAVALRRWGVQNDLVVSGTLVEPWREFEHSDRWPVTGELHILDSTGTLFATVNTPYDQLPPPDYKEGGPEWWQSNKNRDHVKKIVCQTYPSMSEGIMISLEKFLAGLVMYPRKSESNAAQQVNIQKYNIKLEKAEEGEPQTTVMQEISYKDCAKKYEYHTYDVTYKIINDTTLPEKTTSATNAKYIHFRDCKGSLHARVSFATGEETTYQSVSECDKEKIEEVISKHPGVTRETNEGEINFSWVHTYRHIKFFGFPGCKEDFARDFLSICCRLPQEGLSVLVSKIKNISIEEVTHHLVVNNIR